MGQPHEGNVAEIRRTTRANYHRAIRSLLKKEKDLVREKFAESLLHNRNRDFWSEIKKLRGRHVNTPNTIDNCHSQEDIADLFAVSYRQLVIFFCELF